MMGRREEGYNNTKVMRKLGLASVQLLSAVHGCSLCAVEGQALLADGGWVRFDPSTRFPGVFIYPFPGVCPCLRCPCSDNHAVNGARTGAPCLPPIAARAYSELDGWLVVSYR